MQQQLNLVMKKSERVLNMFNFVLKLSGMYWHTHSYWCVKACECESASQSVAVCHCGLRGGEAQGAAFCSWHWNKDLQRNQAWRAAQRNICISSLSVSLTRSTSWLTLCSLNQWSVGGLRGRNHTQASCWLRNQEQTASLNLCRAGFYVNNHNTTTY